MKFSAYRPVLALPAVRSALLLGLLLRSPVWAAGVILTLHVVGHLEHSYTAAGLLTTVSTVALAVNGPWRGRLLDRLGLRRTVLPGIVVQVLCWSIAPFVGYPVLLPLAAVAALYVVPSFAIIRQLVVESVPVEQRTTALALDSIGLEVSFMIGPALGVLTATWWGTPLALLGCQLTGAATGLLLWVINPPLGHRRPAGTEPDHEPDHERSSVPDPLTGAGRFGWVDPAALAVLVATAAATIVLTGTDVGIVAALRAMDHASSIGWVLIVWAAGSAVGGLIYGAAQRAIDPYWLLAAMAVTTLPVAAAPGPVPFAVLLFVAGLFCAPTITATVDALSRTVPVANRGEAMGWHGSALTGGSALGAPVAGVAIDRAGWQGGFVLTALTALTPAVIAGLIAVVSRRRRERSR